MSRDETSDAVCYIVSPRFLEEWFHDFVSYVDNDNVLYIDETENLAAEDIIKFFPPPRAGQRRKIAFCSSHRSLVRDCLVADSLRVKGYTITGINHSAVVYGRDKRLMKQLFDTLGVKTPSWAPIYANDTVSSVFARLGNEEYLFKDLSETSGKGNFYFDTMNHQITDQYYAEVFVEGDEYSVVAVSTAGGIATFPPVWKGSTRRDLYPPYKKLRVCPFPGLSSQFEAQMRMVTVTLAKATYVSGLLEVEFIVTPEGQILVIEINPRIAGTVLLSAMATETKIFDFMWNIYEDESFPATSCAVEMPFTGTPYRHSGRDMYFSPRLAVSGLTYQHIYDKIIRSTSTGFQADLDALDVLKNHEFWSQVH